MLIQDKSISLMNYNIYIGDMQGINFYRDKIVINTLNPHSYCVAKKDVVFRHALQKSDILLADGVGIVLAMLVLKGKKIQQISGPTIQTMILGRLNSENKSCFYLGSSEKTLRLIKSRLQMEYPNIRAGFYSPPYKEVFSKDDNEKMITLVNDFKPDVLFVGMTAPKQEKWVYANKELLDAKIICSIGAAFDFYAGTIRLPHPFFFKIGIGWLARFVQEPKRLWKRNFISAPYFLWEVLLFRIGIKK